MYQQVTTRNGSEAIFNEIRRVWKADETLPRMFVMHQSIPAVPIPPPCNRGAFAHVASPGGRAFAILSRPRGLGISVPRGDPRAFDTRVSER